MAEGDEPPGSRQVVRAEGGFAYGVIGADIHVFGDGTPVYLLENWRLPAETDPQWLRQLPSRMLNARHAVVDFTGREAELAALHRWRAEGPRLGVRWLHGAGGQGKTRLAAHFAAQTATEGWKVVTATHGPGTILPPPGSQDLRLDGARGLLLIVDYADRWPLTHLTWLLSNALLHQTAVRTRILLLARTAEPWPAVRAALANHQADTSTQLLEPLPAQEAGPRARMFAVARGSFAARYGLTTPDGIGPPGSLEHPDFGLTLAVHIAALVAVDAHVTGRRPPRDMAGLTIYLLDREHLHWASLYGDAAHDLHPAERTYATPPHVMNQTVFTAALAGALESSVGTSVLETLQLRPSPGRILADHAVCYPPADPARETVLEPLYPDRLAEDFLALTLPGHEADYPAQPWAAPTTAALLTHDNGHTPPTWVPRTVTFLISAAQRWPHLGPCHLYPLLHTDPQLALTAGSTALTALAGLDDIDPALLEAIAAHFPDHRHADLDPGIAAVTARLAPYRLAHTDDLAERARIQQGLGVRLSWGGRPAEAVTATEGAITAWRQLARASPPDHGPALATSLINLSSELALAGRRSEALTTAEEAETVWRRLSETHSAAFWDNAAFAPGLANARSNLSSRLSEVGRRAEALVAQEQAVALYRPLAEGNPATYETDKLAAALSNLGARLWEVGRREDALRATEEAVDVYRRLAASNSAAHEPDLAQALSNLGVDLWEMGRWEDALRATEEAVDVYRRLAEGNPTAHEPSLAAALTNLAVYVWEVGRREDAVSISEDAVVLSRRLAERNPAAHEPNLAAALTNLGMHLIEVGQDQKALSAAESAVAVYRRLVVASPAAHEPNLGAALTNLGIWLLATGRQEEALSPTADAVAIYERLAKASRAAFEPNLARALWAFAQARVDGQGEHDLPLALAASTRALEIYAELAAEQPARFVGKLYGTSKTLVDVLDRLGFSAEAEMIRRQFTPEPSDG
ncbi:tetratricopeptide repeat protein [Streptomyces echinatus]|uniref:tetratricopeptide repeat protein n=1 Tax=Streptomyces echinatus TaxID=67293 RepID=UPI00382DA0DF